MNSAEVRRILKPVINENYYDQVEYINQKRKSMEILDIDRFEDGPEKEMIIDALNDLKTIKVAQYTQPSDENVEELTRLINELLETREVIANFPRQ